MDVLIVDTVEGKPLELDATAMRLCSLNAEGRISEVGEKVEGHWQALVLTETTTPDPIEMPCGNLGYSMDYISRYWLMLNRAVYLTEPASVELWVGDMRWVFPFVKPDTEMGGVSMHELRENPSWGTGPEGDPTAFVCVRAAQFFKLS